MNMGTKLNRFEGVYLFSKILRIFGSKREINL
jgi:hypothetical protein